MSRGKFIHVCFLHDVHGWEVFHGSGCQIYETMDLLDTMKSWLKTRMTSSPITVSSAPVELASWETLTAASPALSSISKMFSSIPSRKAAYRAGYVVLSLAIGCWYDGRKFTSAQPILSTVSPGVSSAAVNWCESSNSFSRAPGSFRANVSVEALISASTSFAVPSAFPLKESMVRSVVYKRWVGESSLKRRQCVGVRMRWDGSFCRVYVRLERLR